MSLLRLISRPIAKETVDEWVGRSVRQIFEMTEATETILFGSAVRGEFDEFSDLDFVVIFADDPALRAGQSVLYGNTSRFPCAVDLLCVTRSEYEKKSQIGGVMFIAREDGRVFSRPV